MDHTWPGNRINWLFHPDGSEMADFMPVPWNDWANIYFYLGGRPIGKYIGIVGGEAFFFHANHLGSTTMVTWYIGDVKQKQLFYPDGQNWATAGNVWAWRFASLREGLPGSGEQFSQSATRDYAGRFYRWMSPDPLAGDVTNPQSLNRYAYALNNPANFIDPLGLDGCNIFNVSYEGSGNGFPCNDASTHTSQPAESPTSIAGPTGVATGSLIGTMASGLAEGYNRYASNFGWMVQGSLYGHYYPPTFFSSLNAYFDWRTDIAAMPQSKVYAALVKLGLFLIGFDPTLIYEVSYQRRGTTYNIQVIGSNGARLPLDASAAAAAASNTGIGHGENTSYYIGGSFNTTRVVDVQNPYLSAVPGGEGHIDFARPYGVGAPLHGIEWVLSHILPNGSPGSFGCSATGGCY